MEVDHKQRLMYPQFDTVDSLVDKRCMRPFAAADKLLADIRNSRVGLQ